MVLSRDPATGKQCYKRVTRLFRGHTDRVAYVRIAKSSAAMRGRGERHRVGEESGGSGEGSDEPPLIGGSQAGDADEQTSRSTVGHKYYVIGRGWVHALDLQVGDELVGSRGEVLVVAGLEIRKEEADHYNFEVEDFHTYFVSATESDPAVWVHNMDCQLRSLERAAREEGAPTRHGPRAIRELNEAMPISRTRKPR